MSQEKYITMCEQLGKVPSEKEMPPAWEDFPDIVITAVNVFNMLGDRVYPEVGYVGKDYGLLSILLKSCVISDEEFFLEVLNWLDQRAIKRSSEMLKREYDKLKRSSSGKK